MYKVKVLGHFSSAHMLKNYKGKCEEVHGHNWKVEAVVSGGRLDDAGMVMDFKDIKEKLKRVLEGLDHKMINEVPYFKEVNPTSENIAKYIFDKLNSAIRRSASSSGGKAQAAVAEVSVWETDTSCAAYIKP